LIVMGVRNVRRAPNARSKAVAASTIGWSFLFMSNVAMRLVAPSFLFGLTFVKFLPEGDRVCDPVPDQLTLMRLPVDANAPPIRT